MILPAGSPEIDSSPPAKENPSMSSVFSARMLTGGSSLMNSFSWNSEWH